MTGKPGRPRTLTVDQIVQAALDVGLTHLSMPSVARRVGVAHSALYRYVENREGLLVAAVDHALSSVDWPAADEPWDPLLRRVAGVVRSTCHDVDGLAAATLGSAPAIAAWESRLAPYASALTEQGFDAQDADAVVGMVLRCTLIGSAEPADRADVRMHDAHLSIVLAGAANLQR